MSLILDDKILFFSFGYFVPDCGLCYKTITIVNDASRVISELCHNLEHHLQSSIMLQEPLIVLLELSITHIENIYSTGIASLSSWLENGPNKQECYIVLG